MSGVITRKWHTFLDDPVGVVGHRGRRLGRLLSKRTTLLRKRTTLLRKGTTLLRKRARRRAKRTTLLRKFARRRAQRAAQLKLKQLGALDALREFMRDRPREAYPPDYRDLLYLYEQVRQRKPRVVLEFGSGCSTVVMAQALWENRREAHEASGRLYSLDGQKTWASAAAKGIPAHLNELCKVVYSPVREVEQYGVKGLRHEHVPDVEPDFVYLDGPDYGPDGPRGKGAPPNFDVLDLEARSTGGLAIVVDGRQNAVAFLREHLQRPYRFTPRRASLFELDEAG